MGIKTIMDRLMFRKPLNEKGSVTVLLAVSITVLMAFSAVAIDVGRIALQKQSLQNALDAACLAGALELPANTALAQEKAMICFETNGYSRDDIQSVQFFNANRQIRLTAAEAVDYTFANVFGSGSGKTVNVAAAAEIGSVFDPYDYALFSGSAIDLLQFRGKNNITGDVHSNYSIKNDATVIGSVTAVNNIDPKITATGAKVEGVPVLSMPDLSDVVENATVLDKNTLINVYGATYAENKDEYSMSSAQLNNMLSLHQTVFVNGNLTVNGSGVDSTGNVIITGNITYNGSDVSMGDSASVCLFTLNGDIIFNGGSGDVRGILYAPEGEIRLNGNGGIIYGSIIADMVTSDGGVNIIYDSQVVKSLPLTITRLVE